jgi:hypothetical protein
MRTCTLVPVFIVADVSAAIRDYVEKLEFTET